MNIDNLWRDFKEVMYNLEIEDHIDAVWGFFEDEAVFDADEIALQQAGDEGYENGYDDATAEVSDEAYERGYGDGISDGCKH